MATKTIALDTRVYAKLAMNKKEGESFSKAIDRLLTRVGTTHSGAAILEGLGTFEALPEGDSEAFLEIVAENRSEERWDRHDLR